MLFEQLNIIWWWFVGLDNALWSWGKKENGVGSELLLFMFLGKKKKPPSCLWDLRHAGRHLCKPHQLSLAVPRLCKPGRPEWDTIGMSSYLLFIKINRPAGDVCEEFISSSCTSKCPQGEGARKLGGGGGVTPRRSTSPLPWARRGPLWEMKGKEGGRQPDSISNQVNPLFSLVSASTECSKLHWNAGQGAPLPS